jgi:hypothetical protein
VAIDGFCHFKQLLIGHERTVVGYCQTPFQRKTIGDGGQAQDANTPGLVVLFANTPWCERILPNIAL